MVKPVWILEFFLNKFLLIEINNSKFYFLNIYLDILKKIVKKSKSIQNKFAWFFTICFEIIWENIQRIKITLNINVRKHP
jgi:hypothetical protein